MTNKELQNYLKQHPDDMEVLLDRNGSIYTEPREPFILLMGNQRHCIILDSSIKL